MLVGERETCKVTDFGMARDVQQENIYEKKTKARTEIIIKELFDQIITQLSTKITLYVHCIVTSFLFPIYKAYTTNIPNLHV